MSKTKRGFYTEANGRHVYKTYEEYKGVRWVCKGSSMESDALAKISWQKNKEKKIALINGQIDKKEGRIILRDSICEWYNLYKRKEAAKGRERSVTTIRTDEDTIKQIIGSIGDYRVNEIDSDCLQKDLIRLQEKGVSQSIINKRWNMYKMYFDYIYPDGGNPVTKCKKPFAERKKREESDEPITKAAYNKTEIQLLENELRKPYDIHSHWKSGERGYSCGPLLIVILYEFLRIAEGIELRVKDVDFEKGVLHIRRQYQERSKSIIPPKYNSKRDVPIMKECADILKKACEGKNMEELLFQAGGIYNPDLLAHDGHILQGRVRINLTSACERLGLEQHTVHDLRHDGISRLVNMGVKPQSVSRWAGHKSVAFTMDKYYRHTGVEDADDLALVAGK